MPEQPTLDKASKPDFLNLIKDILLLISQLGIFVAISGFVVVQRALAEVTSLYTYNIVPTQYLAAGASLLFYVPLAIIYNIWLQGSFVVRAILIAFGVFLLIAIVIVFINRGREASKKIKTLEVFDRIFNFLEKFSLRHKPGQFLYIGYIILLALFFGFAYGQSVYITTPRWAGGGQPAPVILIFSSNEPKNLPFVISNGRSPVVKLLAELNDGILVWDEQSNLAIEIRNEALVGIIGSSPNATPYVPILPTQSKIVATATQTMQATNTLITPVLVPTK